MDDIPIYINKSYILPIIVFLFYVTNSKFSNYLLNIFKTILMKFQNVLKSVYKITKGIYVYKIQMNELSFINSKYKYLFSL